MKIEWWKYYEEVGTLKPNLLQYNVFELFVLIGN